MTKKQTRAAFYARFSDEKQRETSIEDQFRNLQELADKEGWRVVAKFADKAISGKQGNRPQWLAMLTAAKRGDFDVLLVDELTRFSRDQVDLETASEQLDRARVRVVTADGRYDSAREDSEVTRAVHGVSSAMTNKDHQRRVRRGQIGAVEKGYWLGSKPFGYSLVLDVDKSKLDAHGNPIAKGTLLRIDPEQAKVIREIFKLFADGQSERGIAGVLNTQGIPSPGSTWNRKVRRNSGWMGSAVRAILRNELYSGQQISFKSEWKWERVGSGKRRVRYERPRSQWKVFENPELRIVPAPVWDQVAGRIAARARENNKSAGKQFRSGAGPKYVLSGLLRCAACGAHFVMCSATQYACSSFVDGKGCGNEYRINRVRTEELILDSLRKTLLAPEMVKQMAKEFTQEHEARLQARIDSAAEAPRELQELDARIKRLKERLKNGDPDLEPADLDAAIKAAERKRLEVLHAASPGRAKVAAAKLYSLLPDVAARYERQLEKGFKGNPAEAAKARVILGQLVGGKIELKPTAKGLLASSALHKAVLVSAVGSVGSGGRI